MSLCSVVIAKLAPIIGNWAFLIGLLVGVLIGALNGVIHYYGKIPSFISTFGVGCICNSLAYVICGSKPITIESCTGLRNILTGESTYSFSLMHVLAIIFLIVGALFFKKTLLGRFIYAEGSQEKVADMSGVPKGQTLCTVFILAGLFVGIAAILSSSYLGMGSPYLGDAYTMLSLSSVVMGGTALSGGVGGILETAIGAIVISALKNGMTITAMNVYAQQIVLGITIIVVVAITSDRSSRRAIK